MSELIQRTLVLIKPDGVFRSLVGDIIKRFETAGLKIVGMKMFWADRKFAEKHYTDDIAKRRGKEVREWLLGYITEGPVIAMVLEGVEAVEVVRKIVGPTEPKSAQPGTIRGDYAHASLAYLDIKKKPAKNLIHASGSKKEADEEVKLWFTPNELYEYETVNEKFIR
jgi:nucleoside-diphosphate kinase